MFFAIFATFLDRRCMKKFVLLTLLTLLISQAYTVWAVLPSPQQYGGEVLSHTVYCTVAGSKLVRTDSVVYQINDRSGDELGEVALPFSKNEKLTVGGAWIEDMDGNVIRKLKKQDIGTQNISSYGALYRDEFVRTFTMKHNRYPYRVVYSYRTITSDWLYFAEEALRNGVPVRRFRLTVDVLADVPVRYRQEHMAPPEISESDGHIRYVWTAAHIPSPRQLYAPDSALRVPHVCVTPQTFSYGVSGSWASWQTFGEWIARLNAKARTLPSAEKQKVDGLLNGVTDARQKVGILYQYLQRYTRYVNVKLGVGGFRTYPAAYVVANRYGDCKALCNYMQALLEYAGVPAFYTLVAAGTQLPESDRGFPHQAFNHIILTVPMSPDTLFLECTAKNFPAGYSGTFTQGRDALLIDGADSRFVRTPAMTPDDVRCERKFVTELAVDASEMAIELLARGDEYELLLFLASEMNRSQAERILRQYSLPAALTLTGLQTEIPLPDVPAIRVTAQAQMQPVCRKAGNNLVLNLFAPDLPAFEPPHMRTQPAMLDVPLHICDSIIYRLADVPVSGAALPPPTILTSPFGNYSLSFQTSDDELLIYRELCINSGFIPIGQYADFYGFIQAINNCNKRDILIPLPL